MGTGTWTGRQRPPDVPPVLPQTSTLPVVIISNNNQLSSAWASVLWFNMLSADPKNQLFFAAPPPAPWPRLAEVLSWQFESAAERGLAREHLHMLARKLFGEPSPESTLAWHKFSKDGASGFSFWAWLDGILGLLQEHLKQLWKEGLILGFVSRKQEEKLLRGKRTGTFLIRFSESVLGGVTFSWVEHPERPPTFQAVEPYTATELAALALPDIIHDYQLLVEENIPENPLRFLYPDRDRDEAFGPHYSQRQAGAARPGWHCAPGQHRAVGLAPLWMLQVLPESLEPLQPPPGLQGLQQVAPGDQVTLKLEPGPVEPQLVLQPLSEGQGTLQVAPGGLGTLQPALGGLGTQHVAPGDQGTSQPGSGALEPPLNLQLLPGEQRPLQVAPGELELLAAEELDLQKLLEALEPADRALDALEPAELEPAELEPAELEPGLLGRLGPGAACECREPRAGRAAAAAPPGADRPRPAGSAALLGRRDPFLPQAEAPLPVVSSLFAEAGDFPPLHIDPQDFQ
uniref:SH2 domain-containing protein n=1 Tax=Nothoprocta perdicaria TaxID=30464 RepID=A0A8C7EDP0_NOTPE